jgi:long-chain fatty acid transport protein
VPGLTIGAGLDLVPATVDLTQDVYFGTDTGTAHLGGTAFGIGGRIGVMFKPKQLQQLSLGAMWRSDVKLNFTGTGDFDAPAPYRGQLPPDGDISTSVTLPQSITFGAAYRPQPQLEIEANVMWTNWSKFKSLDIVVPSATGGTMTIAQGENYENTTTFRAGIEYHLAEQGLGLRAGYIYDPTPVTTRYLTAQLPDIDRHDLCIGASKAFGTYDVHLGLLWVLPGSRQTAPDMYLPVYKGTYDVTAFVTSISLAGKFGGK